MLLSLLWLTIVPLVGFLPTKQDVPRPIPSITHGRAPSLGVQAFQLVSGQ